MYADRDLSYWLVDVSTNGAMEEYLRTLPNLKFRPPGSTMTPGQARKFPLLERVVMVDLEVMTSHPDEVSDYAYWYVQCYGGAIKS